MFNMTDIAHSHNHSESYEKSDDKEMGNSIENVTTNAVGDLVDKPAMQASTVKKTQRQLRPRHIQLMALSGAIGTGLFVGTGGALARAGPLGLFLGYFVYALLVWSTFNAVGEMTVFLPVDGSFIVFAHAYLDDAWGFALGWLYTVTNSLATASEVAAVAAIFNFWSVSVNNGKLQPVSRSLYLTWR